MSQLELPSWRHSLRVKMVVAAIVIETFMLSLLLANSYRLVSNALESQTSVRLEALTPLLNASFSSLVFQRDYAEIESVKDKLLASELTGIPYIIIYDAKGKILSSGGEVDLKNLSLKDANVHVALNDLVLDTSVELNLQGIYIGDVDFGLSLVDMVTLRDSVLQQSLMIALIEIFLSLIILGTVGFMLTRHMMTLIEATKQVTEGRYGKTLPIISVDEIGVLTSHFNDMSTVIQNRIEQLKESESRFKAIFNAAGDAIFIFNPVSKRLIDVNQRMCEMYGCSREEALGDRFHYFTFADSPEKIILEQALLEKCLKHLFYTLELKVQRADNQQIFWTEINLRFALIGREERIIALVRDISERKQAEEDQRLAATAFETEEAIMVTDAKGIILRVNYAFTRITGYSAAEAIGGNPLRLHFGHQDENFYQTFWMQIKETGYWRGELWNRRKNGEFYPEWLSVTTVKDSDAKVSHYIGIFSDQSILVEQRRQVQLLLNSTAEGIMGTDSHGIITFANPAVVEMVGELSQPLVGSDLHLFLEHQGHIPGHPACECKQFQRALNGEAVHEEDGRLLMGDGEKISVEYWLRPIIDNREVIGVIMTCVDITARKRAEKLLNETLISLEERVQKRTKQLNNKVDELEETRNELIQSEKMASLGRLVAGFAHEINTPIGIAVGAASLIDEVATKVKKLLEQEEVDADELLNRIDSMVEASRLTLSSLNRSSKLVQSFKRTAIDQSHSDFHNFNLCSAVQDVVSSLYTEFKGKDINFSISCDIVEEIYNRPGAIEQILTNLILNSFKHGFDLGHRSGTITIEISQVEEEFQIIYRDNGHGMEQETRDRIFEPFFTTARGQGGSGLGLFICYNIVTSELNGTLQCESFPEDGTRFELRFPRLEPPQIG